MSAPEVIEADIAAEIGDLDKYAFRCHAASIALVKSVLLGPSRVARGSCRGVGGQHSWVVLGDDCYDEDATIVDVTAWSYMDVPRVWIGRMGDLPHRPKGWGPPLIEWGCPEGGSGEHIELTPTAPFSDLAKFWMDMFRGAVGSLDRQFWMNLLNRCTMVDWAAGEFIAACDDTAAIAPLVPIDLLGMLTDRNPGGLYLSGSTHETEES